MSSKATDGMPERDPKSGRYKPSTSDADVLAAIGELDAPGTSAVGEAVGMDYHAAYKRLVKLENEGKVGRHRVGSASVWFVRSAEDSEESDQ